MIGGNKYSNLLLVIKILGFIHWVLANAFLRVSPKERIEHFLLHQANDGSPGSAGDMNFLNGIHPAIASCLRAATSGPSATERNDPPASTVVFLGYLCKIFFSGNCKEMPNTFIKSLNYK